MARLDNLDFHFLSACNCRVEVVELKPEKHPVSVGLEIWVTERTVMVLHIPPVQLKDEPATRTSRSYSGPPCAL
jgi:hypothetical protein